MLVEQIVVANWRLRRARTAESAEIALSVDGGFWSRKQAQRALLQWQIVVDPIKRENSSFGNMWIENILNELRQSIDRGGELTEDAIKSLVAAFGGKSDRITDELDKIRLRSLENSDSLDASALLARNKKMVLDFLDTEIKERREFILLLAERENHEERARQNAAVLPSADAMDKILRYETALDRQLFRAMNELERLQRRRLGGHVPPPVSMEISGTLLEGKNYETNPTPNS
jgi:hypothetical protein